PSRLRAGGRCDPTGANEGLPCQVARQPGQPLRPCVNTGWRMPPPRDARAWSRDSREPDPVRGHISVYHAAGWLGGSPSRPGHHAEIADANAVILVAVREFDGCLPWIGKVLHRQDLPEGTGRLDPRETLGPGQDGEIDRGDRASPHPRDSAFVRENS